MFQMKMIFFAVPVRRNSEENCETGTKNNCDLFLPMYIDFAFPAELSFL